MLPLVTNASSSQGRADRVRFGRVHNRDRSLGHIPRLPVPDELFRNGYHPNGARIGMRQPGFTTTGRIDADRQLASGDGRQLADDQPTQCRCTGREPVNKQERNINARSLWEQHSGQHSIDPIKWRGDSHLEQFGVAGRERDKDNLDRKLHRCA